MRIVNTQKYFFVFLITLGLFGVMYLASEFFYNERIAQVKTLEDTISRSVLESEIQYRLLSDTSCDEDASSNPLLIEEINTLARRLDVMEAQRGSRDTEVVSLKKYYSLLQVRDYLFVRDRARLCDIEPATVIYFYSNEGDCAECQRMGYVLTSLREEYDTLHIYAFDYNLELSVVEILKSIYELNGDLPVIVVDREPYYGFKTREEILSLLPELAPHASTTEEVQDSEEE
ncbi:MAG: hypothetical protein WDZ88_00440 [Candidatus Paceibacterota bacterium]